jgi:hypothetical protein
LIISTQNLEAFTLNLAGHPRYKTGASMEVTLNDKKVKINPSEALSFTLKDGKWLNQRSPASTTGKRIDAEGPISDAFSDRHIYVYGTKGNPSPEELKSRMDVATHAANWSQYRNAFLGRIMVFPRIVADKDVRQSDFDSANLILFGTRETNTLIEKFAPALPMQLVDTSGGKGLLYVYPVGSRYVVIQSGTPWWITKETSRFGPPLPFQFLGNYKDYVFYQGSSDNVLADGYFTDSWTLTEEQKKKLTESGIQLSR